MPTPLLTVYEGDVHINQDDQADEFVAFHGPDVHGLLANEWHIRGLRLPLTLHLTIRQYDQPPRSRIEQTADPYPQPYLPPADDSPIAIWLPNPAPRTAPSHAINSGPGQIGFIGRDGDHHLRYE